MIGIGEQAKDEIRCFLDILFAMMAIHIEAQQDERDSWRGEFLPIESKPLGITVELLPCVAVTSVTGSGKTVPRATPVVVFGDAAAVLDEFSLGKVGKPTDSLIQEGLFIVALRFSGRMPVSILPSKSRDCQKTLQSSGWINGFSKCHAASSAGVI